MNLAEEILNRRITAFQVLVIAIATICLLMDGFDFFLIGYALPHLPEGFATPGEKGLLISIGAVGMGLGAMVMSPLADRIGRRPVIITGLVVQVASLVLSAVVANFEMLLVARLATGIGVGTVAAVGVVVAQEFSSASARNLVTGVCTLGAAAGATIAGFSALLVLPKFGGDYRALFWTGAICAVIALIVAVVLLPESPTVLGRRGTPTAQQQLRQMARRMHLDPEQIGALPTSAGGSAPERPKEAEVHLLDGEYRRRTLLAWVGYLFVNGAYIFVTTWTPQLVSNATHDTQAGAIVTTVLAIGMLAGGLIFGLIASRFHSTRVGMAVLLVGGIASAVFAGTLSNSWGIVIAVIMGAGVFAGVAAFNSVIPQIYPPAARGKGFGMAMAVSRIGAIAVPAAAGYLVPFVGSSTLYIGAAVLAVVSAVVILRLARFQDPHLEVAHAPVTPVVSTAAEK